MKIGVLGSGAVGGYFGAKLARAGHEVTFIARGAHLQAIRDRGLAVKSAALGDFTVRARAEQDAALAGPQDLVIVAVKCYDNASALPLLPPMVGPSTVVLTLQNGVDSVDQVAAVIGRAPVVGGCTYVATALESPGLVVQTGTHRSIVLGEVFDPATIVTPRVAAVHEAFAAADIQSRAVADARDSLWEKFIYLVPFAGFTGAARRPIGDLWSSPLARELFLAAAREVASVARAEGATVDSLMWDRLDRYMRELPPSTRSSLLIDLQAGKRIEVEALQGSVTRRGARAGVPTPIVSTLYAVLKPFEGGAAQETRA